MFALTFDMTDGRNSLLIKWTRFSLEWLIFVLDKLAVDVDELLEGLEYCLT